MSSTEYRVHLVGVNRLSESCLVCIVGKMAQEVGMVLASFPGSCAWVGRKEPGAHCLHMLSFPRISGSLKISVKPALLH